MHQHFGPDYAVLAGAVATYSWKGAVQDLGLPRTELRLLAKQIDARSTTDLCEQMRGLPAFRERIDAPGWRTLTELAPQLIGAPRSLGQHVGGRERDRHEHLRGTIGKVAVIGMRDRPTREVRARAIGIPGARPFGASSGSTPAGAPRSTATATVPTSRWRASTSITSSNIRSVPT